MNARTKKVLEEALELSPEDRALLAVALEASLDEDSDERSTPEEVEKEWAVEIERRVEDVLAGRGHARPAADVLAEIRERVQAARSR